MQKWIYYNALFLVFQGVFCPRDGFSTTPGRAEGDFKGKGSLMATPAEPRGDFFFCIVQILGGEKLLEKCRWEIFGKDQKGLHKRGIHDQGDFWKFPLETAV